MSILQTIDLKKYYNTKPNITLRWRQLLCEAGGAATCGYRLCPTHNNEIPPLANHIVRIEDGRRQDWGIRK